jgi:hypothetical protein
VNLRVRVNDELVLDAGACEQLDGSEQVIHPPKVTLFHQVLNFLRDKPDARGGPAGLDVESEGVAALSVALRWGSYLAVLADKDKPVWSEARVKRTSRICDSEMARINIEASAALAEWIDLSREDRDLYERLVGRAVRHLPVQRLRPNENARVDFALLARPQLAAMVFEAANKTRLEEVRVDADRHPNRLFANALVNTGWRNGPVEDIHAGAFRGYPLDRRRITAAEERALMGFACDQFTIGMDICGRLGLEVGRSWSEQVIPYGIVSMVAPLVAPSGWTLTESTREVRLRRA